MKYRENESREEIGKASESCESGDFCADVHTTDNLKKILFFREVCMHACGSELYTVVTDDLATIIDDETTFDIDNNGLIGNELEFSLEVYESDGNEFQHYAPVLSLFIYLSGTWNLDWLSSQNDFISSCLEAEMLPTDENIDELMQSTAKAIEDVIDSYYDY